LSLFFTTRKDVATWYGTTDLSPQGSFSAILSTSRAMRGSRSAGRSTSPQASWADFAARSSLSSRRASAWQAPASSSESSYPQSR